MKTKKTNKGQLALNSTLVLGLCFAGMTAVASVQGETSYELMCRAKAKDIAADTYRSCVTENRNAEIEKVKKDYQERLRSLKEDYEKEIDKMGGKTSAKKPAASAKMLAATQPPTKKMANTETESMTSESHVKSSDNMPDESQMDLPEPIPVESMSRK